MKKVLFTATVTKTHINTFHLPYIKFFKEKGYETHVCSKNDFIEEECIIHNCDIHYAIQFERSPMNIKNIKAYKQLKKIINENNYAIIHCNTPVASILTRLAAIKARKKGTKVIYTAHGFHFFKGAPLLNWILYYPAEKICSYFTDVLITINKEDYRLAKNKMKSKKVYYIPGVGVDTEKFETISINKNKKRKQLGITNKDVMLLSVGELSNRKNHEIIIRALGKMKNPNIHYFIAGRGDLKEYLFKLSVSLGIEKNVHLLGFRSDIQELTKVADVFCFPSYQEGLPVAVMEAMATGLPIICSDIRGNIDLIEPEKGGFLCRPDSIKEFMIAISRLNDDIKLKNKMSNYNKNFVKMFDINIVKEKMAEIYGEILNEKTIN